MPPNRPSRAERVHRVPDACQCYSGVLPASVRVAHHCYAATAFPQRHQLGHFQHKHQHIRQLKLHRSFDFDDI